MKNNAQLLKLILNEMASEVHVFTELHFEKATKIPKYNKKFFTLELVLVRRILSSPKHKTFMMSLDYML